MSLDILSLARMRRQKRIAIIGSRTFDDYALLCSVMQDFAPKLIVSGGADGADSLGARWAQENNVELRVCRPAYHKYSRANKRKAPKDRNKDIVREADVVIAFWDGKSSGTRDAIKKAERMGKNVIKVPFTKKTANEGSAPEARPAST